MQIESSHRGSDDLPPKGIDLSSAIEWSAESNHFPPDGAGLSHCVIGEAPEIAPPWED